MSSDQRVRIVGAVGSPYSRKMRAVLRYRRIPHGWINQGSPESQGLPAPAVSLLPQLILPGEGGGAEARIDSTPLIRDLETLFSDWLSRGEFPDTLRALFAEVGRVYVPFLLANADALERRAERVECEIAGRPWTQKPFPYQGKCLRWLREGYAALAAGERRIADALLDGTGCEKLFVG